jgi:hypothetical protein
VWATDRRRIDWSGSRRESAFYRLLRYATLYRYRYVDFVTTEDRTLRTRYKHHIENHRDVLPEQLPFDSFLEGGTGKREVEDWLDRELQIVRPRLMAEQTVLYGEHDRMVSEAEFRVQIVVPLVVLVAILALNVSLVWLLALSLLALLLVQAMSLQVRANLALVEAVTSRKVKSPYLESLESAVRTPDEESARAVAPSAAAGTEGTATGPRT